MWRRRAAGRTTLTALASHIIEARGTLGLLFQLFQTNEKNNKCADYDADENQSEQSQPVPSYLQPGDSGIQFFASFLKPFAAGFQVGFDAMMRGNTVVQMSSDVLGGGSDLL